jgi:uncharacterized protein YcbX
MATIGRVLEIWRYPVKSMQGQQLDFCTVEKSGIHGDREWALRDDTAGEITGARKFPILLQCTVRYRREPSIGEVPHVDVTFPDGSTLGSDAGDINARFSALLGRPVSLWPRQPATNRAHHRRSQPGVAMMGAIGKSRTVRRAIQGLMRSTGMDKAMRDELSREADEPLPDMGDFSAEMLEFATLPGTYFDAYPVHLLTTASLAQMSRVNPSSIWDSRRFRPNVLIESTQDLSGLVELSWLSRTVRLGEVELKCETPTVRCGMPTRAQADLPNDPTILRTIVRNANQHLGVYASVIARGRLRIGDPVEVL